MQQTSNKEHRTRVQVLLCLALGVLLPLCGTSHADVQLEPIALFELFYGEEESQIGIWDGSTGEGEPTGPVGLTVGATGDVYIADYVQGKVKRFNRAGRLIMATEGRLENMSLHVAAPDGRIWVRAGAGADELVEFNPDGSRVNSVRDEDGWMAEPRGGDYILSQIDEWLKSHGLHPHPLLWSLDLDESGRLYVGVWGRTFESGVGHVPTRMFVFSPSMHLTTVVLGDFVSPDGYVHTIVSTRGVNVSQERINVNTADGARVRELMVPEPASGASILAWRGGEEAGVWYYAADRTALYILDVIARKYIGKDPYFLTEQLRVGCDLSIVKTDREGRLLAAFRLPGGPFSNCLSAFVHPSGDIYYFEFGPESLTVNLIRAQALRATAEKSPSKIAEVRQIEPAQARTVALRRGLDRRGWHFKWDTKRRRAIAENAGVRLEVPINSKYVILNNKKVAVARPAYILSGRTYIPSSLIPEVISARAAA